MVVKIPGTVMGAGIIDKVSGIKNDTNDWCREHDTPRYIVDLLKRVTRVSLETMRIVNGLPALNEQISSP